MANGDTGYPTFVHKTLEDGPWAGWTVYTGEPFEDHAGPFFYRIDETGAPVCAMRTEAKHMNGGGFMHGGCMLTFADFCLFAIAHKELEGGHSVTVSLGGEFLGPAHVGDLIECTGEVTKAGRSMVFVRGLIQTGGSPMMSFSGVVKRVARRL